MCGGEIEAESRGGDQRDKIFVGHGGLQDIFIAASNVTGDLSWDRAAFGALHSQSDLNGGPGKVAHSGAPPTGPSSSVTALDAWSMAE
jgi:hypothetical protein